MIFCSICAIGLVYQVIKRFYKNTNWSVSIQLENRFLFEPKRPNTTKVQANLLMPRVLVRVDSDEFDGQQRPLQSRAIQGGTKPKHVGEIKIEMRKGKRGLDRCVGQLCKLGWGRQDFFLNEAARIGNTMPLGFF